MILKEMLRDTQVSLKFPVYFNRGQIRCSKSFNIFLGLNRGQ